MSAETKLIELSKSAIEEIELLLDRKRGIDAAISNLEAFRFEAQEQDPEDETWNNRFSELWEVLEITRAVALANEQKWFEPEDIDRIDDTLLEMRRMLEDKIARLERPGSGSDDDGSEP